MGILGSVLGGIGGFLLGGPAGALAGASLGGGIDSADAQRSAANTAADAQRYTAQLGIEEQRRQFDAIQKLLLPYTQAGAGALTGQLDLLGLNGTGAQQTAITALQGSPQFTSALQLGEDRIRANASATGGLRGGNVQSALAQFSPQLLAQTINDQYTRLGGIASLGQNAAAGVGNAGVATGNNVTNLLQQQGAATAGAALAGGRAQAGYASAINNALGIYAGTGGFGGTYTRPGFGGGYGNPSGGETWDYRGATLPDVLRGGG